jgi:aspartate/methionine/tyrosine aminotransferase
MSDNGIAERMGGLAGESAFQVLAAANALEAKGKKVIHFEIGEPDFPTQRHIVEAGKKALDEGRTTYCNAQGLMPLREAIAEHTRAYKGIETKREEVVVTPGGKPIIFYAINVLVNPGDEVLYPNPGFPTYESVIRYAGGVPVPTILKEERSFRLDIDDLKAKLTPRTKLLILNSPSNPTGSFLTEKELGEIASAIRGRNIYVLSDEIYSRIVYGGKPKSIATFPGMKEKTIVLDGFSKTYCMTGWRLGYGIMNEELAASITRLLINSNSCTAPFVQLAGVAALEGPQDAVDAMVSEYRRRRDVIVDGLNAMKGVTCTKPDGAFYAFPNITRTGLGSAEVTDYLLNEAGVAVLNGSAFGNAGSGYLRISYATSMEVISKGLERIEGALKELAG